MTTTDVAIVGAGPVGLLLANLLGQRGHSVQLLEKRPTPYPMPRAIHFDGETMRGFQAAGLALQILPHTHVGKGMLFKDSQGRVLVDWSRAQEPGPMGWYESYRFYQPGLEYELRKGLDRFTNVTLQEGAEVTGISQSTEAVILSIDGGAPIAARYAIGCDGAQSVTRNALGIGLHDLGFQERWLVIDALLKRPRPDLGDFSVQHCDPDAPATYVRGSGDRRRWEMRIGADDPDSFTDTMVWPRLSRWITPDDATLERFAVYTFRSRIATTWRQGRVLLAGDAAHQMPPFMGQGMCAGIRDAANLGWKISAVLGGVDPALLDSYQSEREPNARAFIEKSVALGRLINQTAAGEVPQGRMQSIWPDLGEGLGPRDGTGGVLAPQVRVKDGQLADDAADHGFYILAAGPMENPPLPCMKDDTGWLRRHNLTAAVIRPDGYALAGAADAAALQRLAAEAAKLAPAPVVS